MMPGWVVTPDHDWINWIDVSHDGKTWRFYSYSFGGRIKLKEPIKYGGVNLTSFRALVEGEPSGGFGKTNAKFEDVSEFMEAIMLALL